VPSCAPKTFCKLLWLLLLLLLLLLLYCGYCAAAAVLLLLLPLRWLQLFFAVALPDALLQLACELVVCQGHTHW
jgi:hypothetical protein